MIPHPKPEMTLREAEFYMESLQQAYPLPAQIPRTFWDIEIKLTNVWCSDCGQQQKMTFGGVTCPMGHGGAWSLFSPPTPRPAEPAAYEDAWSFYNNLCAQVGDRILIAFAACSDCGGPQWMVYDDKTWCYPMVCEKGCRNTETVYKHDWQPDPADAAGWRCGTCKVTDSSPGANYACPSNCHEFWRSWD